MHNVQFDCGLEKDGNIFPRAKQIIAQWFSWAADAICCVKRLVSISRSRSIASIAMQIYVFPRIPTKESVHSHTPLEYFETHAICKTFTRTCVKQLCSCPQLGETGLFHHSQVCFSSTAVLVCKIHSVNEPRGALSETVAHWLCLNGSGALIGQKTHQLLFNSPNSHLRKGFARGLLVVP